MTVKLIVGADQVRDRMALPDHADVNTALDSILPAAHLVFQSILQTQFEVSSHVDTFCLSRYMYPVLNSHYRCRLKQAFVKQSPAVTVAVAFTRSGDYTTINNLYWYVDYEKGIVFIDQTTVEDLADSLWVKITYSAGFDSTNKPPDWLVEGILGYVPAILNDQQTTNRSDESEKDYVDNLKLAEVLLGPYMRGSAFHFRPVA